MRPKILPGETGAAYYTSNDKVLGAQRITRQIGIKIGTDRNVQVFPGKIRSGYFLLLYRNLETVGGEMILRWRATLDVIWLGICSLFGLPFSLSIHSGPSPEGHLFSHYLPMLRSLIVNPGCLRCPHEVFLSLQWKLHEALDHLRKEQEEAWKLEVGERKRTANWKASCPLGKGVDAVPVLS